MGSVAASARPKKWMRLKYWVPTTSMQLVVMTRFNNHWSGALGEQFEGTGASEPGRANAAEVPENCSSRAERPLFCAAGDSFI